MKKVIIAGIVLITSFFLNSAFAQCNSELYVNKSMKSLESGFQFSKSYRIDGRGGTRKKVEYTCVFSKDTNYQIRISGKDGSAQGLIGTLYDSKRNKMVSSFYNNKFLEGWTFKCRATGIYYLSFTFQNSKSYCGAAVLAFRR
ncbi:MAG: hypothetical protein KTR26_02265 [Flammeovirgaceae bacterium]|uniref:hypothetical protein n=1 Tax=Flexithrix dorotheae TaxID=70993 RepID=UPI00036B7FD8|nr:hypothetical protein [Flexithrix dorotheae]MBX2840569.1 hypothetical protein [Flammeovirgaceae bacterium]